LDGLFFGCKGGGYQYFFIKKINKKEKSKKVFYFVLKKKSVVYEEINRNKPLMNIQPLRGKDENSV
jgi:hypothetical protein